MSRDSTGGRGCSLSKVITCADRYPIALWISLLAAFPGCDSSIKESAPPPHTPEPTEQLFTDLGKISPDSAADHVHLLGQIASCANIANLPQSDFVRSAIDRYPGDRRTLLLLRVFALHLKKQSLEDSNDFLSAIIKDLSDQPPAALALDMALDELAVNQPDIFLEKCASIITDKSSADRLKRTALYKRINYYDNARQVNLAAEDALLFWASYPEVAEEMQLTARLRSILNAGDLWLESDILAETETRALIASCLLTTEFMRISQSPARQPINRNPDAGIESSSSESATQGGETKLPAAFQLLQELRKSMQERNWEDASARSLAFLKVDLGIEIVNEETSCQARLTYAAIEQLRRLFLELAKDPRERMSLSARDMNRLMLQISKVGFDLESAVLIYADEWNCETSSSAATKHIDILVHCGQNRRVREQFERILGYEWNVIQRADLMVKAGDYFRVAAREPATALDYYVAAKKLDSSHEAAALALRTAMAMLDNLMFDDARQVLNAFLQEFPNESRVPLAIFLLAQVEAGTQNLSAAEFQVRRILDAHRQHPLAPRALKWMAHQYASVHDYGEAIVLLNTLIERFPHSGEYRDAKKFRDQLNTVTAGLSGQ